jgi:hypothetical protein
MMPQAELYLRHPRDAINGTRARPTPDLTRTNYASARERRTCQSFPIRHRSTSSWCASCCRGQGPKPRTRFQSGCRSRWLSHLQSMSELACCRSASRLDSWQRSAGMSCSAVMSEWSARRLSAWEPWVPGWYSHRCRRRQPVRPTARSIEARLASQHTPDQHTRNRRALARTAKRSARL